MPLYLADIHLRASFHQDPTELQLARDLIQKHHYGRRFSLLIRLTEASKTW